MNKIFRVIWNKVKNCYIVASEYAKARSVGLSFNISRVVLTALFASSIAYHNVTFGSALNIVGTSEVLDSTPKVTTTNLTGIWYNNGIPNYYKYDRTTWSETLKTVGTWGAFTVTQTENISYSQQKARNTDVSDNYTIGRKFDGTTTTINSSESSTKVTGVIDLTDATVQGLNAKTPYIGINSSSTGTFSNYDGEGATGEDSIAIGFSSYAETNNAISLGNNATSYEGIAIGLNATSGSIAWSNDDGKSIAIGNTATAFGDGIAIGYNAKTGAYSKDPLMNGIAIGNNAESRGLNSVALGSDSETNENNVGHL